MEKARLNRPAVIAAIAGALILGLLVGFATDLGRSLTSGPSPESIARSSLESMRAQNRLTVFVARYVSATTSRQDRFGLSTERTLILPGDVRYEIDLAKLEERDVRWDAGSKTLTVTLPDVEIAGPEVDLTAAREYGSGGVLSALTDADNRLDNANRALAVADLRKQAQAETPMRLARDAARAAVARSFAMPLRAAGIPDAKVAARFASDPDSEPSYLDVSRPMEEVLEERRQQRSGQ